MEIIAGVERRRRWSAAEKLRIVAETEQPGAGIAETARRYESDRWKQAERALESNSRKNRENVSWLGKLLSRLRRAVPECVGRRWGRGGRDRRQDAAPVVRPCGGYLATACREDVSDRGRCLCWASARWLPARTRSRRLATCCVSSISRGPSSRPTRCIASARPPKSSSSRKEGDYLVDPHHPLYGKVYSVSDDALEGCGADRHQGRRTAGSARSPVRHSTSGSSYPSAATVRSPRGGSSC